MLDDKLIKNLSELLTLSLEGDISEQQFEEFQDLTSGNPEAVSFCVDFTAVWANLRGPSSIFLKKECGNQALTPETLDDLMKELAEHEGTAPAIEIPKEEPPRELIQKVVYPKTPPRQVSKFSVYTLIISAAAMLFAIIYVQIAPPPATTVATITDSIDAQWAKSKHPTDIGSELWNNEGVRWLHKGVVKIEFDYGAEVIVEGPTGFEMMDAEKMILHSGRLYATAPKEATGFTVQTPYSTIIDLGTEFGVEVDVDGTTDLHMIKGKASLIPGASRQKSESRELAAGQASRVDTSGQVKEISLRDKAFIRGVSSQNNFTWRGEDFNLADVVGGGDGFGTGVLNVGIDLRTGKQITVDGRCVAGQGDGLYKPAQNPYVDGVFVPDGGDHSVQISSTGLCFAECPETLGHFYGNIFNGGWHVHSLGEPPHLLKLGGRTFEKSGKVLYTHSNIGITFDLKAVRQRLPGGLHIKKFTAFAGVSETVLEIWSKSSQVDFRVLVDGQVRVERVGVKPEDGPFDIDVALTDTDRFLTLITTDSDKDTNCDWALFAEPILVLGQ